MDEGYIKYDCRWEKQEIVLVQSVFDEINSWRTIYYKRGWIGMYPNGIGYGNISLRLNESTFIVSGSATGNKDVLTHDHYAIVKGFDISNNWIQCSGQTAASSESLSHAALYKIDQQISRIVHIHNEAIWANYLNVLPTTSKDIAYGTPGMAMELQKKRSEILDSKGVIIMGGHPEGVIVFGNNYDEIFELLRNL